VVNDRWATEGLAAFGLGIGLSTGPVAAALLGSEERLEYTLVGDTVNLAQRLQDLARPAGCLVFSEATRVALSSPPECESLGEQAMKGRQSTVRAFRVQVAGDPAEGDTALSTGFFTGGTP
jgi:adenylate cyclase